MKLYMHEFNQTIPLYISLFVVTLSTSHKPMLHIITTQMSSFSGFMEIAINLHLQTPSIKSKSREAYEYNSDKRGFILSTNRCSEVRP